MSWCCISSKNVEVPVKKLPEAAGVSVDVKVAQKPVMLKFRLPSDEDASASSALALAPSNLTASPALKEKEVVGTRVPSFSRVVRGFAMVIGIYALAYFVVSPSLSLSPSPPPNATEESYPSIFLAAYA